MTRRYENCERAEWGWTEQWVEITCGNISYTWARAERQNITYTRAHTRALPARTAPTRLRNIKHCTQINVNIKVRYNWHSASYTSQTRDQKRFTISEVAADWHELMIPQPTMRPSIARVCMRTIGHAVCSYQTYHSPNQPQWAVTRSPYKLLRISHPAEGRRLSWFEHIVSKQLAQRYSRVARSKIPAATWRDYSSFLAVHHNLRVW